VAESKQGRVARWREARRLEKERKGDSPERLAEHHEPKRSWFDRAMLSGPGGQRHTRHKGDRR
jgi:hypothetical protein